MNESRRKLQMQSLISFIKDAKKYILVITGPNFTKRMDGVSYDTDAPDRQGC